MTWNIALIGMLATVVLMHLAAKAAHALAGLRGHQAEDQHQMLAAKGERGDWYMFFHCSDLTGKETAKRTVGQDERRQAIRTAPTARRNSDRRPRIGLSL